METIILIAPVILSFFILAVPARMRFPYTVALTALVATVSAVPAIKALLNPENPALNFIVSGAPGSIKFTVDSLSAFFMLVTDFTVLTGLLYSNGYLKPYRTIKSEAQLSLHYFCFLWLHLSMLAVLTLREGTAFLIAWELMAVSSFMLILFEAEKRSTLKTAVNYLIQMHIGLVLLLVAFLVVEAGTGQFGFDGIRTYFTSHANMPVFFLFFAGFAIKAGFIPFHTWLPEAHPAAPSHVSGVMSGVMIKMGIFGIVRVIIDLQSDIYTIGVLITLLATITGLYGIILSVVQTDLKKLLAYSTIENVGIIGIGIGLGTLGLGLHNPTLTLLGFGGGLFHVLNHSLFKSLLFYSAGSVYKATHTRNIDKLGGLIHQMPGTAGLFLIGSIAICALPPLNGFFSELLIYYGLFAGLQSASVFQTLSLMMVILALALIGGLALFGFSKAFGITFLGSPRSSVHIDNGVISRGMLFPKILIGMMILIIGFAPMLFLSPVIKMLEIQLSMPSVVVLTPLLTAIMKITLTGLIFVALVMVILLIKERAKKTVVEGPTWGCGYTAATPRQQYTGSSFAANFAELANPLLRVNDTLQSIREEELFPVRRTFSRTFRDVFGPTINLVIGWSMLGLKNIARLQTGNIRHYILYAFIFMLIIFILLYLGLI